MALESSKDGLYTKFRIAGNGMYDNWTMHSHLWTIGIGNASSVNGFGYNRQSVNEVSYINNTTRLLYRSRRMVKGKLCCLILKQDGSIYT